MTNYFSDFPGLEKRFTEAIEITAQTRNVSKEVVREATMVNREMLSELFTSVQNRLAVSGGRMQDFTSPHLHDATWLISQACYDLMLEVGQASTWYRPLNMYYQVLYPIIMASENRQNSAGGGKSEDDTQSFVEMFLDKAVEDDPETGRTRLNLRVALNLVTQLRTQARDAIVALWKEQQLEEDHERKENVRMMAIYIGSAYLLAYREDDSNWDFMRDESMYPGMMKDIVAHLSRIS